jgi:excisionase family DNA binding protein
VDAKTTANEVVHTQLAASVLLGISLASLEKLVRSGKLKTVRVGLSWRVPASEIARLTSSTPAAPPASGPVDTPAWLRDHLPAAEPWRRLWRADLEALKLAAAIADTLPETRADNLLLEHGAAERTASLGYLAELYSAMAHASLALEAHDAGPDRILALVARRERLSDLIAEVIRETAP